MINLLLEKYKVESRAENFALFIVRDNGEQKKLKDDDYPLVTRVILGPHEDIAKLFLMDGQQTQEIRYERDSRQGGSSVELKFQMICFLFPTAPNPLPVPIGRV